MVENFWSFFISFLLTSILNYIINKSLLSVDLGLGVFLLISILKVINAFNWVVTTVLFLNLDYLHRCKYENEVVIEEDNIMIEETNE